MAEEFAEKTEKPTAKRLSKAREQGNVPHSNDLTKAITLFAAWVSILWFGSMVFHSLMYGSREILSNLHSYELTVNTVPSLMTRGAWFYLKLILPFGLLAIASAIIVSILEHGWNFTTKAIEPKWAKLNPVTGWGRFFQVRSVVELLKSILKILIVGFAVWGIIRTELTEFMRLIDATPAQLMDQVGRATMRLFSRVVGIFLVLGIIDYFVTKWMYIRDLKMSKHEVQEEFKQQEGDPKIKSKIRQIQLNIAYGLTISNTKKATVLITNPTHFAVALQYDSVTMSAPKLVAKGTRKVALRMRQIATEEDIPIVENPPLARALYRGVAVGQEIPGNFYQAVAEVLAYVYRLQTNQVEENQEPEYI